MTARYIFMILMIFASLAGPLSAAVVEDFIYDSKGRRDPFVPLIAQRARRATGLEGVENVNDLVLEGIVWDRQGDSIAVLNGVIVREGQQVGRVMLEEIEEKAVRVLINGIEHKVALAEKGEERGGY